MARKSERSLGSSSMKSNFAAAMLAMPSLLQLAGAQVTILTCYTTWPTDAEINGSGTIEPVFYTTDTMNNEEGK